MANLIFNLLAIAFIIAFITDISKATISIEDMIGKYLNLKNVHIKILECSLCQTWWAGLLFLIGSNQFNIINIALVAIVSGFTFVWNEIYNVAFTVISSVINKIYDIFQQ